MNFTEAVDLADYAKQMMIFTTPEQAAALRDLLLPFPDLKWAREVIRQHGTEAQRLSLPWVKEQLAAEMRRRQIDNASQLKAQEHRQGGQIAEWWRAADAWADSLSEDQAEDHTLQAMMTLKESARRMYADNGKTVQTSKILRGIAYKLHKDRSVFA